MDLLSHAPLGQSACMYGRRGFLRLPCFCFCIYLESSGWFIGLAVGQGGPVCMHPWRFLGAVSGPHCIHGFLALPDLCYPRFVGSMDPFRAGTIAAPRHRTLRYPTLTGPTVPCLPAPAPCPFSSACPSLDLSLCLCLCLCLSVIVGWRDCIAHCSLLWP